MEPAQAYPATATYYERNMKIRVPLFCSLLFALSAQAADPALRGLAEVEALGRLNGHALACDQPGASARIKQLMIQYAPKVQSYGAAFEEITHKTFLAQDQASCQAGAILILQAEDMAKQLQAAIAPLPAAK